MNKFEFLFKEPGPNMLVEALKFYGINEIPGVRSNPIILSWAEGFGIRNIYTNDDMAWCGLAHAQVAKNAGKPVPFTGYELIRAGSWVDWEVGVPIDQAMLADTLVFKRPEGHHVAFYIAESSRTFWVLGGNQSNRYGFAEIAKDRCIAVRRPAYRIPPANLRKIYVDSAGRISSNEA